MTTRVETLERRLVRSRVFAFVELMKPELTGLSVLTSLCGFYLASAAPFDLWRFVWTGLGTLFVGGGAGALNQYLERDYDARMRRTEKRPLPSGRLTPMEVLTFGIIISIVGTLVLTLGTNPLTGLLGVLTLTTYLFVYTPLKRLTPLATWMGGFPGALPPVMGWTAAKNEVTLPAFILFAILFFWQIPHFHSLAWLYRKDFARAGFRMVTVIDKDGSRTNSEILLCMAALIPASIGLALVGVTGSFYLISSVLIGIGFLVLGILFAQASASASPSSAMRMNLHARRIFSASLLYLPALMILIAIDRI